MIDPKLSQNDYSWTNQNILRIKNKVLFLFEIWRKMNATLQTIMLVDVASIFIDICAMKIFELTIKIISIYTFSHRILSLSIYIYLLSVHLHLVNRRFTARDAMEMGEKSKVCFALSFRILCHCWEREKEFIEIN